MKKRSHILACLAILALASPLRAATGDEHQIVVLSGETDVYGTQYETNVFPMALSNAGLSTNYVATIFSPNDIYRIVPGVSNVRLSRGSPGMAGLSFGAFDYWDLNRDGSMAFVSPTALYKNRISLLVGSTIRTVVNTGDAAAGDGFFSATNNEPFLKVSINDANQVAFVARTTVSGRGVFVATPNGAQFTVQRIAKVGDSSGDGGNFQEFEDNAVINAPANGPAQVAFNARTSGSVGYGLFIGTTTGVSLVKGGGYKTTFSMNNSGQIVFAENNTIYLGTAAGAVPLIQQDAPAPGGGVFSNVQRPVINDRGDIAFAASVAPPYRSAFFIRLASGEMRKVAEQDQAFDGGTLDYVVNHYTDMQLNNNGMVMFVGDVKKGSAGLGAIFLGDGIDLVKLVSTGDSVGDFIIGETSTFGWTGPLPSQGGWMSGHASFNDFGQVAHRSTLTNGKVGIFLSTPSIHWRIPGAGNWEDAANWTFSQVPGAGSNVIVDPGTDITVSPPAAGTTVSRLTVGNNLAATRLALPEGAVITTSRGTTITVNALLSGAGHLTGGLTVAGIHERNIATAQTLSGAAKYLNTGHLRVSLTSDSQIAAPAATGALSIDSGAKVDVQLNDAGSTVDFSTPFWDDIRTWRLFSASSVTGTFLLGQVSADSLAVPPTTDIGTFSLVHTKTAVDLVWTPFQSAPTIAAPGDIIAALGSQVDLTSSGTGNALRHQWRKNGAVLSTGKSATFTILKAALSDAASYTVTATNAAGSVTSAPVTRLGIVNVNVPNAQIAMGGKLNLTVSAAVPKGVTPGYVWRRGMDVIADGATPGGGVISGATTAKLSITKMSDDEEGLYTCTVTMGSASLPTLPADVKVVVKPVVTVAPVPQSMISAPLIWQLAANEFPSGFVITGLPSGLTYNRTTGLITGTPNVSGSVKIKVSGKNAAGTGAVQEFTLNIDDLPDGTVGNFSALLARNDGLNGGLGGLVTFTVQPNGTLTGTLRNGASSHNLISRALASVETDPVATLTIKRAGKTTLTLNLVFDGDLNTVSGTLSDVNYSAAVDGRRHVWSGTAAVAYAAAYNSVVELPVGSETDEAQPLGAGWQQMTVKPAGTLTGSGRTPDGVSYTFGGSLWPDASVPQFVLMHGNRGSVTGLPKITLGATIPANRVTGWVEQAKTGPANSADRTYKTGIPLLRRELDGAPWIKPTPAAPIVFGLPEGTTNNAAVAFNMGGVESATQFASLAQGFRITKANTAVFATAALGNPCNVKLSIESSTGLVNGSFNLTDPGATKPVPRAVKFAGILLSHRTRGLGYFTLPGLTPTVGTSAILGGRVEITVTN